MTSDEAHDLACKAFGGDSRIYELFKLHGDDLYLSLFHDSTMGKWVEFLLLGVGDAKYVDDPAGKSVVVAKCIVDPGSGECEVVVE